MHKYQWVVVVASLVLVVVAAKILVPYFSPFIIGLILAALLDPFVDRLESKGIKRALSALILVLLFFLIIAFLVLSALAGLWSEMQQLTELLEHLMQQAKQLPLIEGYQQRLPSVLVDALPGIQQRGMAFLQEGLIDLMENVAKLPTMAFGLVISALTAYFTLKDKRSLGKSLYRLVPGNAMRISRLKGEVITGLFAYFRAQFILVSISAALSIIGFFVIGMPYSWVLGSLAGFLDLIPMIGPSGVYVPAIIYYILYENYSQAILIGIVWASVLTIRQLFEPSIVGRQLGLHPLSSIVGIYLGLKLLGFSGFFIGPIIMIVCKALLVVLLSDYYQK